MSIGKTGNVVSATLLLESGAKVDVQSNNGTAPLHVAGILLILTNDKTSISDCND